MSNGTAGGVTTTIYPAALPGGSGSAANVGSSLTVAGLISAGVIIPKTPSFFNALTNATTTVKIYTGNYTLVNPYNDYYLNAYLEYLAV